MIKIKILWEKKVQPPTEYKPCQGGCHLESIRKETTYLLATKESSKSALVKQKLSLIEKFGQRKKYGPICLLDSLAKVLEGLIRN